MSSTLASRIPRETWDSHMHIVDPYNYPLSATAAYKPHAHLLPDALSFESSLNIHNIVIVQPSIYGTDNSCTLDALRAIGPARGRAVVQLDPATITAAELDEWHRIGVRGVRLNFKSVGAAIDEGGLRDTLVRNADVVRGYGWVVQLYIGMENMPVLERIIASTEALRGIKFCIDHLGHPTLPAGSLVQGTMPDPYALPGFAALVRLLKAGQTWTKCSAAYRIEKDAAMPWTQAMAKEVMKQAPERVVFATDWPHTRFDGYDVVPFVERCLEWCAGDERLAEKLFSGNCKVLFDV
ncbi:amidohydrolase 2 [Pseudovirgaria hyperparasitica]|uniref:Amidohydrolase 2 n=1 Tax=Pseudovirgaria hyperparasitica TaxID=470096 RepID=A0A6A6W5G4_9PEZI|nr:amidohydrolase 2 [Pseudovirgaria hyperparasitica]KAF2757785.1 amidohydrolase 2 [Pseudovirgaria hyperparasitica]